MFFKHKKLKIGTVVLVILAIVIVVYFLNFMKKETLSGASPKIDKTYEDNALSPESEIFFKNGADIKSNALKKMKQKFLKKNSHLPEDIENVYFLQYINAQKPSEEMLKINEQKNKELEQKYKEYLFIFKNNSIPSDEILKVKESIVGK